MNQYAFVEDVAGDAGITGVATDPFDWGVPSCRSRACRACATSTPTERTDTRLTLGYTWTRPLAARTRCASAATSAATSATAAPTPTRAARSCSPASTRPADRRRRAAAGSTSPTSCSACRSRRRVQYGPGDVHAARPVDEPVRAGRLAQERDAHLQPRPALRAAVAVRRRQRPDGQSRRRRRTSPPPRRCVSGGTGPFTGAFPTALCAPTSNNVAPRVGFAWRAAPGTIVRGGYGISFNSGSYSTIARQMVAQPPFAVTNTQHRHAEDPLTLERPVRRRRRRRDRPTTTASTRTTRSARCRPGTPTLARPPAGLERRRRLHPHPRLEPRHRARAEPRPGRAAHRGRAAVPVADVRRLVGAARARRSALRRRPVRGIGGGVSYTLARSRDNASTIGGGGTVVAQNDQDLDAEWGLSSFDRRHQLDRRR